jgi:hypothetical protein
MSIAIDSIEILQTYLNGVMERSGHHAENVEGVSLALLGAVMWKSTGEIEVKQYDGRPANILWFFVGENRYALVYNHVDQRIELRERVQGGTLIASFDNSSTYQQVIDIFSNL